MPNVASAIVAASIGAMLFFSAVVAPTAFRALSAESAGLFVRSLFPSYFLINGAAGVIAAILALRVTPAALLLVGGVALIALRLFVVPAINAARDAVLAGEEGAKPSFARLHRLSVIVNLAAVVLYGASIWLLAA